MSFSAEPAISAIKADGFTLVELMLTILIAAILLAVAVPSFRSITANNALRTTTADLVTAVNTARAQAVNQRAPVTLAASANGWGDGWTVQYTSANSVMTDQTFVPAGGVSVTTTGATSLTFQPSGLVSASVTFTVCDGRSQERGQQITVGRFGTIDNQSITCN